MIVAQLAIRTMVSPVGKVIADALMGAIAVAAVLDIAADWRGLRGDLVLVWPVQHVQHVALVEHVLRDIPMHARGVYLRSLLGPVGTFVPIVVYVPREHARRAEQVLRGLFDPSAPPPNVEDAFG